MVHRHIPFGQSEAAFAGRARQELASLSRDMKVMRDSMSGLQRALKVPKSSVGKRYTKTVRTSPSVLASLGAFGLGSLLMSMGGAGSSGSSSSGGVSSSFSTSGSFSMSSAQIGLTISNLAQLAQRIG